MPLHILVIRAQPEAAQTARALRADGHSVLTVPLLQTSYYGGSIPDLAGVYALLLSSVNGARALTTLEGSTKELAPKILWDLPCFVVGPVSAQAARNAGLKKVYTAKGNGTSLGRLLACHWKQLTALHAPIQSANAQSSALHITGRESANSLALSLKLAGIPMRRHVLYEVNAVPYLPITAAQALAQGSIDTVCLHSPRTGRIFVELLNAAGLSDCLNRLTVLCLSHSIAHAIKDAPWHAIRVAEHSDDTSLRCLALRTSCEI